MYLHADLRLKEERLGISKGQEPTVDGDRRFSGARSAQEDALTDRRKRMLEPPEAEVRQPAKRIATTVG
jgi:hypothetical protein